ncbi:MAG TPA: serine protease inhibitor ecotin [Hyphomonadaceae bacterium]|nr:serine protease inhibitor ecotin [Hyphomonadaceae bacterium]
MRLFALTALAAIGLSACTTTPVEAQPTTDIAKELEAFPAATAGQKRHVVSLPALQNEDEVKVELIVGQTKTIDCNRHSLGGELKEETLQGWGYTYFSLPSVAGGASTKIGCPPGSDRQAFVTLPGQTLVRYNSRLPIVLYTPDNVEVRYRLWRAGDVRKLD